MPLPEAIDTMRVHRVSGLTGDRTAFVTTRLFRAPYHTISDVDLSGGGQMEWGAQARLAGTRSL